MSMSPMHSVGPCLHSTSEVLLETLLDNNNIRAFNLARS